MALTDAERLQMVAAALMKHNVINSGASLPETVVYTVSGVWKFNDVLIPTVADAPHPFAIMQEFENGFTSGAGTCKYIRYMSQSSIIDGSSVYSMGLYYIISNNYDDWSGFVAYDEYENEEPEWNLSRHPKRLVCFGAAPQEVSKEFYDWFVSNATKQVDANYCLYNGVLLPKIPKDVFAEYPYAFIIKGGSRYNLVFSTQKYWYQASDDTLRNTAGDVYNLWLTFANMDAGSSWTLRNTTRYYWGSPPGVIWSNYDIPNGSETATDIYFEATEPVPTV